MTTPAVAAVTNGHPPSGLLGPHDTIPGSEVVHHHGVHPDDHGPPDPSGVPPSHDPADQHPTSFLTYEQVAG